MTLPSKFCEVTWPTVTDIKYHRFALLLPLPLLQCWDGCFESEAVLFAVDAFPSILLHSQHWSWGRGRGQTRVAFSVFYQKATQFKSGCNSMSGVVVCILQAVLYLTDQHLAPFYRLCCKIANLWDIDLKFSGFISDVNSDNPAKFCEVSMPRSCISKNRFFRDFGL